MKTAVLVGSVAIMLAGVPLAQVADAGSNDDRHAHKAAAEGSCIPDVHLTEAAEKQLGGALYKGPIPEPGDSMPATEGAHMDHYGKHGGTFFMAPDKIHHIEASYSEECGVRLFIFNAFTKPISVRPFQAIVKFVPEDEYEFEAIRFLSPTEDGAILYTRADHGIEGPFNMELYLMFPGSDEPEMFNIQPQAAAKQFYDGVGVIVAVKPSDNRLVVDHEQIEGFMGAMEMSYIVTPVALLQGLEPGDKVRFTIDANIRKIVDVAPLGE